MYESNYKYTNTFGAMITVLTIRLVSAITVMWQLLGVKRGKVFDVVARNTVPVRKPTKQLDTRRDYPFAREQMLSA